MSTRDGSRKNVWISGLVVIVVAGLAAALVCLSQKPQTTGDETGQTPPDAKPVVGEPIEVIIDQSYDQFYSPFDTGFSGLSRLNSLLAKNGARVSVNQRKLSETLPKLNGTRQVLVLLPTVDVSYSPEDKHAIAKFMERGGGVLVSVEHDNMFGNAEFQNALTASYGIWALPSSVGSTTGGAIGSQWPRCNADLWGISRVMVFLPAPLVVDKNARPLLGVTNPNDPNKATVGAIVEHGAGRLAVLGDVEIFWNMTADTGLRAGQNRAFVLRLFGELAGLNGPLPTATPALAYPDAWKTGAKHALFEELGNPLLPDGRVNGLTAFAEHLHKQGYAIHSSRSASLRYESFDLVVVAVPTDAVPANTGIIDAKKRLLLGDGRMDLLGAYPELAEMLKTQVRIVDNDYDYPLNPIAALDGFSFIGETLVATQSPYFFIPVDASVLGRVMIVPRVGAIELTKRGQKKVEVWASSSPETWGAQEITPIQRPGQGQVNPFQPPNMAERLGSRTVVVAGKQVLGIADVDLLSDQMIAGEDGQLMLSLVDRWLEGGE